MTALSIGFLPLTDAAALIAAADFGFAEAEGLTLHLQKDVSWANLRDKLMIGRLDAAHFLGALAISTSLGIGHRRSALRAPLMLNRNGNGITLAARVADELLRLDPAALDDWRVTARTLARALENRRAAGRPGLTFGTVFPFSTHTYLLRRFFAAGGLDPDKDVEIVVTPPPYTVDLADRGIVDGFCVGSPWNSLAVESGKGVIAALGSEILPDTPEKVLAVPAASPLLDTATGEALVRAIVAAADWCASPINHERLCKVLARADRIDCRADIIARTLSGKLVMDAKGRVRTDTTFLRLSGPEVLRPSATDATWLYDEMVAAGQTVADETRRNEAAQIFTGDLYDRAMNHGPV